LSSIFSCYLKKLIEKELFIIAGKSSKLERTQEAINASNMIDIHVNVNIPKCNTLRLEKKYKCTCCGNSWDIQKSHFSMSKSPLYQSNNGYIHICNDCRDSYYYQLIDLFGGSEEKAIEYMCQQFGWFFHINALEASRQISSDRSRISHYLQKKNLGQTAENGSTDIDTLKFNFVNVKSKIIESVEHLEQLKNEGMIKTSTSSAERWGVGIFSDEDYKLLEEHYRMLKKTNPNCDSNQEIFIKDLCYTKLQQMNAMRDKKPDDFETFTKLYRDTFKQAGLKTVQDSDSSNDEVLGVTLASISQYTPEEYYSDKKLYKDYDGLGSYITRFITRPIKNLMSGSNDRDEEYCVKDGDDDE
jgi:hypothetical protein